VFRAIQPDQAGLVTPSATTTGSCILAELIVAISWQVSVVPQIKVPAKFCPCLR
jgi:hypothetical protein